VTGRAIGVQAASVYAGSAYLDVRELFTARGLDPNRFDNLAMHRRSVPLPCEDVVSCAVNAAYPLVAALSEQQRSRIETLVVATESGVDFAKAASTYVHDLLGLSRNCRLFEVKQACYAGVAALQSVAALTAASPRTDALALVVAADLPNPKRGSYGEAACGAGAVAMLLGSPRLAVLQPGASGLCSYETNDFSRPLFDVEVLDIDHSLLSYIDCLLGSFHDFVERFPGTDFRESFAGLAMHTPFPGMVRGAHRTAMRKLAGAAPAEAADDFERRVAPSVRLPQQVGNIYSASAMLALVSTLAVGGYEPGSAVGLYSYGAGCSAEFLSTTVGPQRPDAALLGGLLTGDSLRTRVDVASYDKLVDRMGDAGFGTRDARLDLDEYQPLLPAGQRRLLLSSVTNYRRTYAWVEGG
jgi:polyketide biosynthesis 3-hydroxy-3-methylglutaryl-CoA synthase-like enzyme PksG